MQPAGLLIEPAEQRLQFSHLSFQEYLCADFINTTLSGGDLRLTFEQYLLPQLDQPGWDEVGLLLLAILQAKDNSSHLRALSWLDPSNEIQAQLLVTALGGGELGFRAHENYADLADWTPLALACCLLHPNRDWGTELAKNLQLRAPAIQLLEKLFDLELDVCLEFLSDRIVERRPWGMSKEDVERITKSIIVRWCKPSGDKSWSVDFGADEARAQTLLSLLNSSAWLAPSIADSMHPIAGAEWQDLLVAWLQRIVSTGSEPLLRRGGNKVPKITYMALEIDILVPATGSLYQAVLQHLPLDSLLLQGEVYDGHWEQGCPSQTMVLLALYARAMPPVRCRIALMLYQALMITEHYGQGAKFLNLSHSRSRLLSQSRPRLPSGSQSFSRSKSRALSLSQSFSRSHLRSQLRLRTHSQSLLLSLPLLADDNFNSALATSTKWLIKSAVQIDDEKRSEPQFDAWVPTLETYCYRWAALDWFREQSEDTGLAQRRGIKDKQPLPAELGLFDSEGIPLPTPERAKVERLLEWLEDDERVIAFGAADATPEELEIIRADLEILRHQPWSPAAFVRAILADWPEDQATMDCSLAAADAELGKQSELLIINNEQLIMNN